MSTRDLIDAIEEGNAASIQSAFEQEISSRIAERLDAMRQDVAKGMFNEARKCNKMAEEEQEVEEEIDLDEATQPKSVHPDAIHVKHVGGGKYKVHAVGKNFEHGIKAGEHLSDSELDDFSEMGGKIKHMKEEIDLNEEDSAVKYYMSHAKHHMSQAEESSHPKAQMHHNAASDYYRKAANAIKQGKPDHAEDHLEKAERHADKAESYE